MAAIYSDTVLNDQQETIKKLAEKQFVYITEHGSGKYIFTTEKYMQQSIDEAVQQALYEQRLQIALSQSRSDFENGNYYTSKEEMLNAVKKMRQSNA
jgi:hypothetical protein